MGEEPNYYFRLLRKEVAKLDNLRRRLTRCNGLKNDKLQPHSTQDHFEICRRAAEVAEDELGDRLGLSQAQ